jgi:predicted Zn finger-like uncharacterized protein
MIVTCKECGKMYRIDPSKLKGKLATLKCRACGNNMIIRQPKDKKKKDAARKTATRRTFGLKGKIFTLFFVVPIVLIITAGYLFIDQLNGLAAVTGHESAKMVTQMAENIILDKAIAVAREVKLYLDTHPDLRKEDFNKTPEFVEMVMQKVGETGYTLIVERETDSHPEYLWVHPNKKLIGIDITDAMKRRLGDNWERWNEIRSKPRTTKGYYLWFDNKEKYCASVPIEGTPFNIVSSTYIDEFTQPVNNLQTIMTDIKGSTLQIVVIIVCINALLVAVITIFYGHHLTSRIIRLTNVTDRISLGDMDVSIDDTGKDELGDLAQAISRMQYSIRMAIERLGRSRSRRAIVDKHASMV